MAEANPTLQDNLTCNKTHSGGQSPYCSAPHCSNSRKKESGLSFFGFPRDRERCVQWILNCGRTDLHAEKIAGKLTLCEEHFEHVTFMNPKDKGVHKPRKTLVPTAVPTLFYDGNKSSPSSLSPELPVPSNDVKDLHPVLKPILVPSDDNWKAMPKDRRKRQRRRCKADQEDLKLTRTTNEFKTGVTSFRLHPAYGDVTVKMNLQDAVADVTFILRDVKRHDGADVYCGTISSTRSWRDRSELMPTHTIHIEQ